MIKRSFEHIDGDGDKFKLRFHSDCVIITVINEDIEAAAVVELNKIAAQQLVEELQLFLSSNG